MPTDVEEFFDGKRASSDGGASDSPGPAPESVKAEGEKPDAKSPAAAKQDAPEPDDDKEEPLPNDKEGLLRAIAAVRGDRRRERKKWREVEKELQEERKHRDEERHARARLEGELTALRQTAAPKVKQEPGKDEDPEELFWKNGPHKYLSEREQRQKEEFRAELAERDRREIERDRVRMIRQHDDYEAAERAFVEAAQHDPSLVTRAKESGDAVHYAYEKGKELQRLREYGEVSSIADLEAKIRAKVEAELSGAASAPQTAPTHQPVKPPIPSKSIATARGSSVGTTREWSGPRDASTFFTGPRV